MVKKVANNDFSEVKGAAFAVVDFSATWCGPCKMLAPVLEEVAEEMGTEVSFFNVDVDDNMNLAEQFAIQSVPSLVFFKNGEMVGKSIGFLPKPQLVDTIKSYQ